MNLKHTFLCLFALLCSDMAAQSYIAPVYKGGDKALSDYISDYLPKSLFPTYGSFIDSFDYTICISRDNAVRFVNVTGNDADFRKELKRIIRYSTGWSSGRIDGIAIDTCISGRLTICVDEGNKGSCRDIEGLAIVYYKMPLLTGATGSSGKIDSLLEVKKAGINDFNLAKRKFENKDYASAIAYFKSALEKHYTPAADVYFNVAVCYAMLSDAENACLYFQEASRLGDADAEKVYKEKCGGSKVGGGK